MKTDKHFHCNICQRGFTRTDHLKRHHLRHSGQKPYSCIFCNDSFARCDNLRDHYTDCARRGDREIPETGQRGRRRHACQTCTSMKLRCDGRSPCGSCQKRNLMCNNERTAGPAHIAIEEGPSLESNQSQWKSPTHTEISAKQEISEEPSSDRGSIKFLLNGGTDSFTKNFRLPPHSDRGLSLNYHNRNGLEELQGTEFPYNVDGGFIDSDSVPPQFFQDTFLDFLHGPFGDGQKPTENPYHTGELGYQFVIPPGQHPSTLPGDEAIFEPERPFAMALIQSILAQAWQVPLDSKAQDEVSANLTFMLTTARIRKYITLYFKYWQPSCAMLAISFDPEVVPLSLLAAVVFMGAMYSSDQREVYAARRVLDFAELFVFANDVFSTENEISAMFSGGRCNEENNDWSWFQNFQAGLIITIVQYWAGNRLSRNRAMENRFSEVVKVARRIELVKARHLPDDQVLEHLWIQKECRIRTISIISLLDCAFFFYQNYPCRLTHTEMECDLPCDESVFFSEHPFAEPNFCFSRGLMLSEAFENLFDEAPESNTMKLTALDMFILIHILYSFINTHMTLLGSLVRTGHFKNPRRSAGIGTNDTSKIPEDSILISIRTALSRWRDYWIALRNGVTSDEWASMGFYKNGYNFWLVSQLLITNKNAVDVVMQMEVHCEDKLEKLKVLLLDDQEEL